MEILNKMEILSKSKTETVVNSSTTTETVETLIKVDGNSMVTEVITTITTVQKSITRAHIPILDIKDKVWGACPVIDNTMEFFVENTRYTTKDLECNYCYDAEGKLLKIPFIMKQQLLKKTSLTASKDTIKWQY